MMNNCWPCHGHWCYLCRPHWSPPPQVVYVPFIQTQETTTTWTVTTTEKVVNLEKKKTFETW